MSETKVSIRDFYKEHKDTIAVVATVALGISAAVIFRKRHSARTCDLSNGLMAITDTRGTHICGLTTLGDLGQHGENVMSALNEFASDNNDVSKDTIVYVDLLRIAK